VIFVLIALLLSTAIGVLVVWMLAPRPRSAWAALLHGCLAVLVGQSICSALRLVGMCALNWTDRRLIWFDLAALIGLLALSVVTTHTGPGAEFGMIEAAPVGVAGRRASRGFRAMLISLLAVAGVSAVFSFGSLLMARPHGNWDAWAMWNMKARFLYLGGANWRLVVGDEVAGVRPDYPMLLPLTVARLWTYAGSDSTVVPRMVAALFSGLTAMLLFVAVGRARGIASAALALLVLLGSDVLTDEGTSQYADMPLCAYILGAIVVTTLATEARLGVNRLWALAGALAGCAAWTKNEGLLFCVALFLSAAGVLFRAHDAPRAFRRLSVCMCGAAPMLLCVAATKLSFVWQSDLFADRSIGSILKLIGELGRYRLFGHGLRELMPQIIDPSLLLLLVVFAAVGIVLRRSVTGTRSHGHQFAAAMTLVITAAGYMVIYLTTPHDVGWHLRTSLSRIVLHIWPGAIFVVFCALPSLDDLLSVALLRGAPDSRPAVF